MSRQLVVELRALGLPLSGLLDSLSLQSIILSLTVRLLPSLDHLRPCTSPAVHNSVYTLPLDSPGPQSTGILHHPSCTRQSPRYSRFAAANLPCLRHLSNAPLISCHDGNAPPRISSGRLERVVASSVQSFSPSDFSSSLSWLMARPRGVVVRLPSVQSTTPTRAL